MPRTKSPLPPGEGQGEGAWNTSLLMLPHLPNADTQTRRDHRAAPDQVPSPPVGEGQGEGGSATARVLQPACSRQALVAILSAMVHNRHGYRWEEIQEEKIRQNLRRLDYEL